MSRSGAQPGLGLDGGCAAAPFLKWAGGKGQLLVQLEPLLPKAFGRYVEPFVGGGAMFFYLHNTGRIPEGSRGEGAGASPHVIPSLSRNLSSHVAEGGERCLDFARHDTVSGVPRANLGDLNAELINCYRVVQDAAALPELIALLRQHARGADSSEHFYRVRAWDRQPDFLEARSRIERAARTIFLNKTCYNGLYRLNSKGQFNVPYGKWTRKPKLFEESNLWACHRALQGVELCCEGFEACLERAREGDFVYLDPPYDPLSRTASFTAYTGMEFRERHQRRLAEAFRKLGERGVLVMLSNSATALVRRLYEGFRCETVRAGRAISCRGEGRGKIEELVVMSY